MRFSQTDTIDGKPIYVPDIGSQDVIAPILDSNSGLTDSGIYLFNVVRTRKQKVLEYERMTQAELTYTINLFYDSDYKPKEVLYSGLFNGKQTSFYAYCGSNLTTTILREQDLYESCSFSIVETKGV